MKRLAEEFIYDASYWRGRISLPDDEAAFTEALDGVGPICPLIWEELRRRSAAAIEGLETIPNDLFFLGQGEPRDRSVTKIGGLPYRPRGLPWPKDAYGRPFTFLCQFRLAESRDIVGETPGDVLLVFAESEGCNPCFFEWHPLGIEDLAAAEEVPSTDWIVPVCYGVKWRSVSYRHPRGSRSPLPSITAAPMAIAGIDHPPPEGIPPQTRAILILSSFRPQTDVAYPWMNVREPIAECDASQRDNCLNLIDTFTFMIYISDHDIPEYELLA